MTNKLKLSASAAVLALLIAGGAPSVKAADVVEEPGCTLSGAVGIGYMYTWSEVNSDNEFSDKNDLDVDWSTPFGEAGGLVTCGAWNAQADFAYYDHTADVEINQFFNPAGDKDFDFNGSNSHFGGALFWRDPSFAAIGIHASVVGQDTEGFVDSDLYRIGIFGEWYAGDMFTLGGAVHYFDGTLVEDVQIGPSTRDDLDHSGWEFTANARFYVTPDFSLMVQGDYISSDLEIDQFDTSPDITLDGWALTGEAEYLVWDQGLSIFAGARYAERELETEFDDDSEDEKIDIDDTQVYAGIKFYFGQQGTLIERQRTGLTDNTSTMLEKLPSALNDLVAASLNNIPDPIGP